MQPLDDPSRDPRRNGGVRPSLLVTIGERRGETRQPYELIAELDENTTDPEVWGASFPSQYESYLRTTDSLAPGRTGPTVPGAPEGR
ncbi:MAG: hypothetical protein U5R14_11425 [Gemmatimonadota bacterium]|nr:hypothetical protein [Gemmatimonadota bacterium]